MHRQLIPPCQSSVPIEHQTLAITSEHHRKIQNKFLQVANYSATMARFVAYLHLVLELLLLPNLQVAGNLVPFHAHICDTTSKRSILM